MDFNSTDQFIDGVLAWKHTLWIMQMSFFIVITILALFLWFKVMKYLQQRSKLTQNPWDDIIINSFKGPGAILVFFLGLQASIESFLDTFEQHQLSEWIATIHNFIIYAFIFWILLRLISRAEISYRKNAKIMVKNQNIDRNTIKTIFYASRAIVALVAVVTLLDVVGISVSGLLAAGGLGGILLGFAAKDSLSNFFAGALIFWERPFVVGDWIRQPEENIEGVVEDIGWRSTQIRTFDHRPLYVPNSKFFNSVIENPQRMTNRRIYEYMGLRYADIDKLPIVLKDIRNYLENHDELDHDQVQMVNFDRYNSYSIDFFVYVMTKTTKWKKFHDVKEDVLLNIAIIIKKHGCDFAFPTQTVHYSAMDKSQESIPPPPAHIL